jgi:hypothetical protein
MTRSLGTAPLRQKRRPLRRQNLRYLARTIPHLPFRILRLLSTMHLWKNRVLRQRR